jgi:CelD/BcsL family acetyltransferase involved in cellulose biosynthesis
MEAVLSDPSHDGESDGGDWRFSLSSTDDRAALRQDWRSLEAAAHTSFFLSWDWIDCWLDHLPSDHRPHVLRAERAGRLAGLALLIPRRRQWLGMSTDALHLHETGDATLDALTIEHNGILAAPGLCETVMTHAVEWLLDSRRADELHLPGIPAPLIERIDGQRFAVRLRDRKPTYAVNLDALREAGTPFVASLSANSRAHLRRVIRQFAALGTLRMVMAESANEALAMLDGMIPLHQSYWQGKGRAGAFANPGFVAFHRRLIARGFDQGCIQFLRCEAGPALVGYLYNFAKDGRIYSYQSGFDYTLLPRSKPGWLCHHLAIEDNLRRGMAVYDLLAGKSQFKASFAKPAESLVWAIVERAGWRPSLMGRLRQAKTRLRKGLDQGGD